MTGIEPALAYWIYAGQDLKSCVLPLHYTRNGYKDNEKTTKCSPVYSPWAHLAPNFALDMTTYYYHILEEALRRAKKAGGKP